MNIELKKWTKEDDKALQQLCDEADRKYLSDRLPYPYTMENARWWLDFACKNEGKNGVFRKVLADGKVIGNITVERLPDVRKNDGELGFVFAREYWGKGIATEAAKLICDIAFRELSLNRLTAQVYEGNIASRRVLEKCGFTLEGNFKNAVTKGDKVYNLLILGKLK